mmetsp:Transcript_43599/g.105726  ORF Transcript_43599/g.105726 Transcript_43599/m.105726 type:complete len:131 (-) Transcript_43599:35-427(-)
MKKQLAPTNGDNRSPTRLNFQQNPAKPSRFACAGRFGSRGFPPSNNPGLISRRYVHVQIINNSIIKTLEKSKIALMVGRYCWSPPLQSKSIWDCLCFVVVLLLLLLLLFLLLVVICVMVRQIQSQSQGKG